MKPKDSGILMLYTSIGSFGLLSISFLLMPIPVMRFLPGILFWTGLVAGIVTQVLLEKKRRMLFEEYLADRKKLQKPRCGALTFRSNPFAVMADVAMLIGALGIVVSAILTKGSGYVCYVFIAMTVFAFCMHCILNGRNYFHIKNQDKVRRVLEQKKPSNSGKGEGNK